MAYDRMRTCQHLKKIDPGFMRFFLRCPAMGKSTTPNILAERITV